MNNSEIITPFSNEDLSLFSDVSNAIHAIKDFDEMLRAVLHKIKEFFQISGTSLALHEPDQKMFYFIRTVEMQEAGVHEDIEKMHFPDHLGVAGWVLRQNQTIMIPDVTKDKRVYKDFDLTTNISHRSMVCVPLRTPKGIIGVLYAIDKSENRFTPKDSWLLEILCVSLGMAIENAKNFGALKQRADSLELENRRLLNQVRGHFDFQGVVASSPAMQRLFALLEKLVGTKTTILLQGETGSGKDMIAKVIHYNGPFKHQPFVAENCGALSEHLLESELFGHVRGAFTGAVSDKKGLFEMADGGTVLLDEIGELTPSMQVKFLRVLQEGKFRPVGGSHFIKVKVRIIASTNRNLDEEVTKGNFREDLYYRINVFPITIPPLRERIEDIPLLAAHFLKIFSKKLKIPVQQLSPKALELLSNYSWPGNVRELQNEMERAVTLARGEKHISEKYLSRKLSVSNDSNYVAQNRTDTLREVTEKIEKQMLHDALENTKGNRSRAAAILGITRQGLLNKIKRYDIDL